jgi:hypothetical protein
MIEYQVGFQCPIMRVARDMVAISIACGDHVEAFHGRASLGLLAISGDPRTPARRIHAIITRFYKWYMNGMYGKISSTGES